MKTRIHKGLSWLLSLCMVAMLFPMAAFAENAQFKDMPNNYATSALQAAVQNGLLKGSNGKLRPTANLTRAEMATILNHAFGAAEKSDISGYTDVPAGAWYANEMAMAVHMKTLVGSGKKLNPNAPVTRQEALTALASVLNLPAGNDTVLANFKDNTKVASWARSSVAAMVAAGYAAGDGVKLNPTAKITRADFAVIMNSITTTYITKAGTYTENITGNVMVNVPGVVLKNITITGNLIIGDGVGDGDVTLDGVTVTGKTIVRGGGVHSIKVINKSNLGTVTISKVDGAVRVAADASSKVEVVVVNDGKDNVIVEGNVAKLNVAAGVPVTVQGGTVGEVSVTAAHASVTVASIATVTTLTATGAQPTLTVQGTVTTLTAANTATGASIAVAKGAKVGTVNAAAVGTAVTGEGSVTTANVTGNNVNVATPGTSVTVAMGVTGAKSGDKDLKGGTTTTTGTTTPTTPIGGGSSTVTVSAVTVTGDAVVGATLTAAPTPGAATGTYQWKSCDSADGTYANITGATSSTYVIDGAYEGKFIKVTFTASGSYTGTQTSTATAAIGAAVVPTVKATVLAFTDTDTATGKMGGTLTWTAPANVSNVTQYVVYASADGTTKGATLGTVTVGTNQLVIPANTTYAAYLVVVAKNATGEALVANYASVAVTDVLPAPEPDTYTVTFEAGTSNNALTDITGATNYVATATATAGVSYTAPVLSKDGYTFDGWFTDAACTTAYVPAANAITASVTLYAKFTADTYTVTFEAGTSNNALTDITGATNYVATATATAGVSYTAPVLSKDGYTFDGWFTDAACTTAYVPAANAITASVTLYAKFTADTYTVTFEAGTSNNALTDITGATNYVATATATAGVSYTAPVLSKDGYTFDGWFTDAACTTAYVPAANAITASVTLYAKFTADTYTVTFEAGTSNNALTDITGATNYVATATATAGVSYTAPVLSKDGYTFDGWFTDAACTTAYVPAANAITASVTLYAKFTADTYTVTFEAGTSNNALTDITGATNYVATATATAGVSYTAPVLSKDGYTFDGWFTDAACTTAYVPAANAITANVTLYAKFTADTYTVTFEAGTSNNALTDITGATNYVATATATAGVSYTAPVLSKDGYTFDGWFTDAACTTAYVPAANAITANITLYAKFTAA